MDRLLSALKEVLNKEVLNSGRSFEKLERVDGLLFTLLESLGVVVGDSLVGANHVLVVEQVVKLGEELFLLEEHAS